MKTNTIQPNIPSGWKLKKLSDVLDYERPDAYIVKSTSYSNKAKTPVLTANKSFILGYTDEDFGVYENVPAIIFDDFTTDSKLVDFPFKIKSSAIKILKEKNKDVDLRFVFEKMKSVSFPTGSHKRFYISQYQNLEIALPPIKEQQKIAEILGTVDEDIAKTQEMIEATEKLKRGLMQQLFTRGIGHTKFKETKIGQIPEEWEMSKIESIGKIKRGPFGGALKKDIFVSDGYKVYEQKNAIYNDFSLGNYFITEKKYNEMLDFSVKPGDILISCSGTLGKVAVVPNGAKYGVINQALLKISISEDWDIIYCKYLLESEDIQNRFTRVAPGSAMKNMASMPTIRNTEIAQPSLKEQKEIAEILSAVDEKISVNKKLKEKLKLLKKGLMQDLLSGNKRTI